MFIEVIILDLGQGFKSYLWQLVVIISECFEFNTEFIKVLEIQEDYLRLCIQKQERVSSCINHAIWKHEKNINLHVKNSR